jgi:hypothetical protein
MNFFMADSGDHIAGKTGLEPTVTISKNGSSFTSPDGAVTEIGNGWYSLAGNATDRNTLGEFLLHAEATGADPADEKYTIESHDPFNLAEPGDEMDLVDAPNSTAITAIQNGLATPTNITAATGVLLSTAGIKAIWDFLTVDVTAAISSFANLFKTNIDAKISESGGGLDAAGIRAAIGMSSANLDEQLETILLQISALGTGTGPIEKPYYVSVNGVPCGDVLVIMSLDAQREYPIHKGTTDATGYVKFYPNVPEGTKVYMWSFKTGFDFNNPDEETV